MSWADLSGARVLSATVTIPKFGAWVADVELLSDATIPAAAVLTLGDLVLVGAVVRSAPFASSANARLVGGAGGWR